MTVEERYSAFPKLMGAPAYARPPSVVEPTERPFDPDALPILAEQTPEERALLDTVHAPSTLAQVGISPWPVGRAEEAVSTPSAHAAAVPSALGGVRGTSETGARSSPRALAARPFSLRDLTDRLRGQR